jgi:sigma-B regulation protein RsbU (phosphoserine phosphatase)
MAVTKTLIKAKTGTGMGPEEILSAVNDELCRGNDSGMFVTVFLGIININTGEVTFSNGGHNLPYLVHYDGNAKPLPKIGGMALGVMEGLPFGKSSVALQNGDALVLYTDGVTEAVDVHTNLLTDQRLADLLQQAGGMAPREVCQLILDEVAKFSISAEQADDITVLVLKWGQA